MDSIDRTDLWQAKLLAGLAELQDRQHKGAQEPWHAALLVWLPKKGKRVA